MAKIEVDSEDAEAIIEALGAKVIVEAFEALLDDNDSEAESAAEKIAADWAENDPSFDDEPEEDEMFRPLNDWDRDSLKRAIAMDDGRRVIDILKGLA